MMTDDQLHKLTQLKDIIQAAQAAKEYVDGINAALDERITVLKNVLDALVGTDDATQAIDTFREVVAFLNGIEGTTLDALLTSIRTTTDSLARTKQDVIADLAVIRSGAAKGATAYQKPWTGIPASDLAATVQSLLDAAGTALQPADIETLTQKVDTLESLVGTDSDNTINKFNEIVAFLAGIGPTDTLDSFLSDIATQLGTKYEKPGTGIPKTDLSSGVQASLGKADTAYQVPGGGIPASDLTAAIQSLLEAAGTALQPADIETLTQKVAALETLINADADGVIDKFNEIVDFLAEIDDTSTLAGIVNNINDAIAAKYTKPGTGIPKSDLSSGVQASLGKADTALQFEENNDPASLFT